MRFRPLTVSLAAIIALAVALPAAARAPEGTAIAGLEHKGGCSVTVTYGWSDFKGRDLFVYLGAVRSLGGGAELWRFVSEPAQGAGSASHTFDLSGTGTFTWVGGGRLVNARGRMLAGSDVRSETSVSLNCPPPA